MGRLFDNARAVRLILLGLVIVILGVAAVMIVMSRGQGDEVSAENSIETVDAEAMTIDTSEEYARELYGKRVEDVNDTSAVVDLMEAMKLEDITGGYDVTITADGDTRVLTVAIDDSVQKNDKKTLDDNMKLCAQQMMALMPSVGKVQWTYPLISAGAEDETVTVSLDEKGAAEGLKGDIEDYGASAGDFRDLLMQQAGEK